MGNTSAKPSREYPPLHTSLSRVDYYSVNSPPAPPLVESFNNEDLRIGTSLAGKMSPVRRFFCLLTTFDILFTLLLWLMCTMMAGGFDVVRREVVNYSVSNSFFDLVMLSAWKFVLLIAAYALFRISHWWVVSITTAGSTAFILAKVFLITRSYLNHTASILLLLCSFILSWGEAWFLDFKVVPSEMNARILLAQYINDCTPKIPEQNQYASSEGGSTCFFSPTNSERGSDSENEEETTVNIEGPPQDQLRKHLTTEEIIHKKRADEGLEKALAILTSGSWKTSKVNGEDIIQSQYTANYGKIFKFVGVIDTPVNKLVEEFFFKSEEISKWNPTVKYTKVVQKIDNHTDVCYTVASEGAHGLVSSRDFVNARTWQKRDSTFVCSTISTVHPEVPLHSEYIRGEQGPSVYVLSPVDGDVNKCHMQWLLITNLKGWLPQYLIDQGLSGSMLDCIHHIRCHMNEVTQT